MKNRRKTAHFFVTETVTDSVTSDWK